MKFLNGGLGDVLGRGAHILVGDIQTVEFDAGGAAVAATERDGFKAVLGGVEIGSVLDLYSGLELRQIKEVSAVDRQIGNLLLGQNSGNLGGLRIDLDRAPLHLYHGRRGADGQFEVAIGSYTDPYDEFLGGLFKTGRFCRDVVLTRNQRAGRVITRARRVQDLGRPGGGLGQGNLRVRHRSSAGVRNGSLNCSGGVCDLGGNRTGVDRASNDCEHNEEGFCHSERQW